ncbi:MAG: hypothetical protein AMJ81_01960 [Phycisphaerae bacterium SM23_33]|jgi:HSP20 family protein|nr:MAG: hypothetical protein AMJ81_01960 [Phycisphaerae bacterium SM23_33]
MAIFRWGMHFDPLAHLRQIQRELDRVSWPWTAGARRIGGGTYPPVNVYESDAEVVVQCEVAGVEPSDLDVSITGETLTVKGIKKPLPREEELNFIRRERGSGEFTRTVVLPNEVDAEKVEANLRDGVMTIRLPKKAAGKPTRVEIKG